MERGNEWTKRVAKMVGARVAHFRKQATDDQGRPLTVQALSSRCGKLGLELSRPTISKLEKGLRQTVTVDELLVLAKALSVSPADLVFPLEQAADVEVLPGEHMDTWKALLWFAGLAERQGKPPSTLSNSVVPVYQVHAYVLEDTAVASREHRQTAGVFLRQLRADMRERGWVLPDLPGYIAPYVDNGELVQ
jgi:transcriptional regulator with XRE-family HTH domain